jgi:hypothetical protein
VDINAHTSCLSGFLLFLLSCETCETEIQSEAFQGDPREAFLRAALGTAIVWLGFAGRVCCALQSSKLLHDFFRFVQAIRCARGFSKNMTVHFLYFIHFFLKIDRFRGSVKEAPSCTGQGRFFQTPCSAFVSRWHHGSEEPRL